MSAEGTASADKRRSLPVTDPETQLARSIITTLLEKGIKLLALDFDRTIVSVHTSGYWKQGTPKLAEAVRPCFVALIRAALESSMHVCVVTYSTQAALIRDVLKFVLPKSDVSQVMIRANSKDWLPSTPGAPAQNLGKQQHIAWICTEIFNRKHVIIESHEILLMDDDLENVQLARDFGHQGYEVPEDITLEEMYTFAYNLQIRKVIPCQVIE